MLWHHFPFISLSPTPPMYRHALNEIFSLFSCYIHACVAKFLFLVCFLLAKLYFLCSQMYDLSIRFIWPVISAVFGVFPLLGLLCWLMWWLTLLISFPGLKYTKRQASVHSQELLSAEIIWHGKTHCECGWHLPVTSQIKGGQWSKTLCFSFASFWSLNLIYTTWTFLMQ